MVILISGSVNSGKTSTSKLLARKLNAEWIDIDEVAHSITNFDLSKDIPKALDLTIGRINKLSRSGKNVVANYVLRQEDYERLLHGLVDKDQQYFTLAPKLKIAQSDRGRGMNDWKFKQIKRHYDTGIATPKFGRIIDTSDMTLEDTVHTIMSMLKEK